MPSAHPYILLNYHGRTRDVMTLAHELGHGVHQVLAGRQGYLLSGTPLTLAETASVFGEMLTFRALLDAETDPARRRVMLAAKVEDMLNTVVRQIAFYQFETRLHDERRGGELVPERIGEIWLEVQRESLGPAFEFTPDYAVFWSYVPHFIHSPFYVYAYAFGDCLVNALYGVFQRGHPGFRGEVSRHAARRRHQAASASCWRRSGSMPPIRRSGRRGLDVIAGFIDELEQRPDGRTAMPTTGPACSANCAASRAPPARWAGSPRASPASACSASRPTAPRTPRICAPILGGLKGPLMKVAQFLSTVPDALPAEYAEELAQLQANAPAMGWAFVRRRMASELGPIGSRRSQASATTPRRRRASARCIARRCTTARDVACKLQYPDMASTVEADLRQLRLAMAVYHRMDNAIQHEDIYTELCRTSARGARLPARGGADAPLRAHAGRRSAGARAAPVADLLDAPAADHDLARRPPAAERLARAPAARRSATASPRRCSAPGTCRSTATA